MTKKSREKGLRYYGKECFLCGYDDEPGRIHVHHIDGNRDNNTIFNLIPLCVNCHNKVHNDKEPEWLAGELNYTSVSASVPKHLYKSWKSTISHADTISDGIVDMMKLHQCDGLDGPTVNRHKDVCIELSVFDSTEGSIRKYKVEKADQVDVCMDKLYNPTLIKIQGDNKKTDSIVHVDDCALIDVVQVGDRGRITLGQELAGEEIKIIVDREPRTKDSQDVWLENQLNNS